MYTLNTDGGARGNPGPAACAYVLKDSKGNIIKSEGEFLGTSTNNFAEYKGLEKGLHACVNLGVMELKCYLDSELVVRQLNGIYKVKDSNLKVLYASIQNLSKDFKTITFEHVLRAKNKEADAIVNQVLDSI